MDARFGSPEYAREELCAELVSSLMQGVIGLPPGQSMIAQHSAYLASWLQALKNDKTEIFRAAANAQKICVYVSKLALSVDLVHQETPIREPAPEPKTAPWAQDLLSLPLPSKPIPSQT